METFMIRPAINTDKKMPDREFLSDKEAYRLENFASTLMVNAIIGEGPAALGDSGLTVVVNTDAVSPGNRQGLVMYLSEMSGILGTLEEACALPAYRDFFGTMSKNFKDHGCTMPMVGTIELNAAAAGAAKAEITELVHGTDHTKRKD